MDLETIYNNIDQNAKAELEVSKQYYANLPEEPETAPRPEPTDLYQERRNARYEEGQKSRPKGTSQITRLAVKSVVEGDGGMGLARAYKRAKDDSDYLKRNGDRERAEIRRQQYMEEYFLPAVEIVVNSSSPDSLLNSPQDLATLDKYAILEGSGRGYTAAYIRQAYGNQLGQQSGVSEPSVRSDIIRINRLLDNGELKTALGIASRLKKKVDNGELMADDNDYELASRIIAYYC